MNNEQTKKVNKNIPYGIILNGIMNCHLSYHHNQVSPDKNDINNLK